VLLIVALLGGATASAAQPRKPALTADERKALTALITEFRQVRMQPEKRFAVIDRMARLGPIGLANLLEVINVELFKRLADYRQAFSRAAATRFAARTQPADLKEIMRLREEVLDLSKDEGFTKQQIISVADPALARLKELILISPADILASNPNLPKQREALTSLGGEWERCSTLLLAKQYEEDQQAAKAKSQEGAAKDEGEESLAPEPPSFAAYLAKEEEIATALAMPMDADTRRVLALNAQLAARLDPEEARCVLDLNLTRNLLGLDALQIDLALTAAARDHCQDMETLDFFSHESPVEGKKSPQDRAERFKTSASAENIAMGTLDGAVANKMWWHSPGHHRNMLGDHERVGVGKHGRHWTEMFGD
jgi:uncharacterized protein YkwD